MGVGGGQQSWRKRNQIKDDSEKVGNEKRNISKFHTLNFSLCFVVAYVCFSF